MKHTICAISTPSGHGGIAIIRVSGKEALFMVGRIYRPAFRHTKIENQAAYTVGYGEIYKKNEIIDNVLVSVFHAPRSFTGEDTVEIHCHGSMYIQQAILKLLLHEGCRLAEAGEFTKRAFLNGKMDLYQAEAVADLIVSSSKAAHYLAMNQMRGGFGKELQHLRSQLLEFVSLIELELDFGEEEVEFASRMELLKLISSIETTLSRLVQSFSWGNAIKHGVPVVLVGETNVGKSTLLNHLLHEEKAIVSDIHGTTRDSIEDTITIQDITFRVTDTAGIRKTSDAIEMLGIEQTFRKIKNASIIVWLLDAAHPNSGKKIIEQFIPNIKEKQLILVFNKIDRLHTEEKTKLEKTFLSPIPAECIYLSAKYKQNTNALEKALLQAVRFPSWNSNEIIITNMRHYEAFCHALKAIQNAKKGLNKKISSEFISQDLRQCMHYLGEITGEITTDEILRNIFKNFCIGK